MTPNADCRHKNVTHVHGTHACYVLDLCRCDPCRTARRDYERVRSKRNAYGRSDMVDAEPVREHVRALIAAGMGHKRIVGAAGGSGGQWTKMMYGYRGRPPAKRIRKATAARYLAIPIPQGPADMAPGRIVDPTGTRRRIQALARLGWSVQALADRYGIDRQRLDGALRGRDVQADTAAIVARMFEDLWDTPAPTDTHRQRISAARARNRAASEGWAAPLDWDDDTIDDPEAEPCAGDDDDALDDIAVAELMAGRRVVTGAAERRTAVLILAAQGLTSSAIAARIGASCRTIERWRAEAAA